MKVFIFDVAKCNGCYNCQIVCKDEHVENDWTPIAKPQPEIGHFWMKVNEKTLGSVPKVRVSYTPTPCMHCDDAPCITAGSGAVYKRPDGMVIIDPEKAQGNSSLVNSCPYGAIYWNEELKLAQKCTGCAHLLDEGQIPRCVEACCTDALLFGEEEDFADLISQAEVLLPESGSKPRVYYLNLPKNFVSGEVWDAQIDEDLEDVTITLIDKASGEIRVTKTDDFGDFWFNKLPDGVYSISMEKGGYLSYQIDEVHVNKSINIGDIQLKKA
ncbi:carboxypeptidase regulatory-like domain-containing protein [Dehalobacter sp. DCM]|uniref:4Fe-4S dicluster domain-containing protein n=1 Tax=Dehalobacter sp. DCM TaxID=2907827 RepID=UPI003081A089|nr:carboxypeptidase regulatory-like domain-containing protein [Dehalobacter sp. DCM]